MDIICQCGKCKQKVLTITKSPLINPYHSNEHFYFTLKEILMLWLVTYFSIFSISIYFLCNMTLKVSQHASFLYEYTDRGTKMLSNDGHWPLCSSGPVPYCTCIIQLHPPKPQWELNHTSLQSTWNLIQRDGRQCLTLTKAMPSACFVTKHSNVRGARQHCPELSPWPRTVYTDRWLLTILFRKCFAV